MLAFVLLLVCARQVMAGQPEVHRTPYIPSSADTVLERVPPSSDPRVRRLDQLRAAYLRYPTDMQRALALSRAYIDYGRSTGDARYLGRGWAVIAPWMRRRPVPAEVALLHATVLQSRHLFQAARRELQSILTHHAENAQAWLTLSTVALVQGDYRVANDACVHLATVSGDFMGILCTAQLRSVTGHAQQAYALLSLIEHPGPEAPVELTAYVEGLMAEAAIRLGRTGEAEAHFKEALQLTPGDNFLLADYGDFLLDQDRPREVVALVKDYAASDTCFLRLVFAEARLKRPRAPRDIAAMQARFAAMDRRGTHVFRREQAAFVLYLEHDPQRALELAERNWATQRAPQDMRIYLDAALAAHQPDAAAPALAALRSSHLQDRHIARAAAGVVRALAGQQVTAMYGTDR